MSDLDLAKQLLIKQNKTCVIYKNNKYYTSDQTGILPLLQWIQDIPSFLVGSSVADKVVGRALALLVVYANVKDIYGEIISKDACSVLEMYEIPYTFGKRVDYISNKTNTSQCPMEKLCENITDPQEAYVMLKQKVLSK